MKINKPQNREMKRKNITFPPKFKPIFLKKMRYKIIYGGRGSAKSWSIARILLAKGASETLNILCAREIQTSIKRSVHKLLSDQIKRMGLSKFYKIHNDKITGVNGTEFTFTGLFRKAGDIKGAEAVDIVWIDEAESISLSSWINLTPTIRKDDSEIWISLNPKHDKDIIYKTFIGDVHPDAMTVKMNYYDNPWFNDVLQKEMEHCKRTDPDLFAHVWEGECEKHSDAEIFKDKWRVRKFTAPANVEFFYGVDFGESTDPTTLVRMFIHNKNLYIDKAKFWYKLDLDEYPSEFLSICPELLTGSEIMDRPNLMCDDSRPGSVRYLRRYGINAHGKDGTGKLRIRQGITYIRGFNNIIVHDSLTELKEEFEKYSRVVDPHSGVISTDIKSGFDHGIDAIRYALKKLIKKGHKYT